MENLNFFNLFFKERNWLRKVFIPILCDEDIIFDSHANSLFGNIDAWLTCKDHTWCQENIRGSSIMDIEPKKVWCRVWIISSGKFLFVWGSSFQESELLKFFIHPVTNECLIIWFFDTWLELGLCKGFYCENACYHWFLTSTEFSGENSSNIRSISSILSTKIYQEEIMWGKRCRMSSIMENSSIVAACDDGRVRFRCMICSKHSSNLCLDLIFICLYREIFFDCLVCYSCDSNRLTNMLYFFIGFIYTKWFEERCQWGPSVWWDYCVQIFFKCLFGSIDCHDIFGYFMQKLSAGIEWGNIGYPWNLSYLRIWKSRSTPEFLMVGNRIWIEMQRDFSSWFVREKYHIWARDFCEEEHVWTLSKWIENISISQYFSCSEDKTDSSIWKEFGKHLLFGLSNHDLILLENR